VPYLDPERQRAAKRESARRRRRGPNGVEPAEPTLVSGPLQLEMKDLLAVLEGQLAAVCRRD
jgi:hypothetical protein